MEPMDNANDRASILNETLGVFESRSSERVEIKTMTQKVDRAVELVIALSEDIKGMRERSEEALQEHISPEFQKAVSDYFRFLIKMHNLATDPMRKSMVQVNARENAFIQRAAITPAMLKITEATMMGTVVVIEIDLRGWPMRKDSEILWIPLAWFTDPDYAVKELKILDETNAKYAADRIIERSETRLESLLHRAGANNPQIFIMEVAGEDPLDFTRFRKIVSTLNRRMMKNKFFPYEVFEAMFQYAHKHGMELSKQSVERTITNQLLASHPSFVSAIRAITEDIS